jgi:hypothetical protein
MSVIELGGIRPTGKAGITAVSQYNVSENRRGATVIKGFFFQVFFSPVHIVFRMIINPWVIEGSMVWNEIEEKLQPMIFEPVPELEESFVSAEILADCVPTDSERRSGYVLRCKITQRGTVFLQKAGVTNGDFSACFSVIPHTQKPDPVETQSGNVFQKCIRDIGEGGLASKLP